MDNELEVLKYFIDKDVRRKFDNRLINEIESSFKIIYSKSDEEKSEVISIVKQNNFQLFNELKKHIEDELFITLLIHFEIITKIKYLKIFLFWLNDCKNVGLFLSKIRYCGLIDKKIMIKYYEKLTNLHIA